MCLPGGNLHNYHARLYRLLFENYITIFSDSQAKILALASNVVCFVLVLECRLALYNLLNQNYRSILWVPSHSNISWATLSDVRKMVSEPKPLFGLSKFIKRIASLDYKGR